MTQPRIELRAGSLRDAFSANTLSSVALGSAVAAVLAVVSFASGGYAQAVWPWIALPMLWACVLVLVRPAPLHTSRAAAIALALFLAWSAWASASLVWSIAPPQTALAVERNLVYAGFLGILVLVVRGPARAAAVIDAGRCRDLGGTDRCAGRLSAATGNRRSDARAVAVRATRLCERSRRAGGNRIAVADRRRGRRRRPIRLGACGRGDRPCRDCALSVAEPKRLVGVRVCARVLGDRTAPRPRVGELGSTALFLLWPSWRLRGSGSSALRCRTSPAIVVARLPARSCSLARSPPRCSARGAIASPRKRGHSLAGSPGSYPLRAWTGRARRHRARWLGDQQEYWRVAWRMFIAHPMAGSGSGSFAGEWVRLRSVAIVGEGCAQPLPRDPR